MEEQNEYFNYSNPTYDQWMDADVMDPEDSNVFSRWFNPQEAEISEFQRENIMMDKENKYNEYMFNKANEWNSASAQMERAKQAGINPMLAAAGIAGSGATATPMQSAQGSVGMNQNNENPMNMVNTLFDILSKGSTTANALGKLFGYGKENKATIEVAKETAKNLASDTGLKWQQERRLKATFEDFCREMSGNADAAQKKIEEMEAAINKYNEEVELMKKQESLTEEQTDTQKELKKQEWYKNQELEFKKRFRELFGVQLNDSDASMLAQLILNGHGEEVINALTNMASSVVKGFAKAGKDAIDNITDPVQTIIDNFKDKHKTRRQLREENKEDKKAHERKYNELFDEAHETWKNMTRAEQRKYNNNFTQFWEEVKKGAQRGYSGRW